jgi:hypothetical protein
VDGFDDVPILVQNLAQCRHLHPEITLRHYGVGPDPAHDLIFCEEDAARLDQDHQKIESAGPELDALPIDQKFAHPRQHATSAEPNGHVGTNASLGLPDPRRISGEHWLVRKLP